MPATQPDKPGDDFQRAAAAAEALAGKVRWSEMTPREQTEAIYAELRRIDAVSARLLLPRTGHE